VEKGYTEWGCVSLDRTGDEPDAVGSSKRAVVLERPMMGCTLSYGSDRVRLLMDALGLETGWKRSRTGDAGWALGAALRPAGVVKGEVAPGRRRNANHSAPGEAATRRAVLGRGRLVRSTWGSGESGRTLQSGWRVRSVGVARRAGAWSGAGAEEEWAAWKRRPMTPHALFAESRGNATGMQMHGTSMPMVLHIEHCSVSSPGMCHHGTDGTETWVQSSTAGALSDVLLAKRLADLAGSGTSFLPPRGVDARECRDVVRERTGEEEPPRGIDEEESFPDCPGSHFSLLWEICPRFMRRRASNCPSLSSIILSFLVG